MYANPPALRRICAQLRARQFAALAAADRQRQAALAVSVRGGSLIVRKSSRLETILRKISEQWQL